MIFLMLADISDAERFKLVCGRSLLEINNDE